MPRFQLQFPEANLARWAGEYRRADDAEVERVAPTARARGFLLREEFLSLCDCKSKRPRHHYQSNSASLIAEVSKIALGEQSPEVKIRVLLLLAGVNWPTASVILHFCDRDRYPLLDFRALSSLGIAPPPAQYTFPFWWEYTAFTRRLGDHANLSMRDVDRALWQFSKSARESRGT